ncbi:MAG TPA: TonB-dependent receptor [Candidatus Saccharimonadales bacterium]|nr:TonB-dependent receptor [Candidatus Saccharimonadales bacterium]
MRRFLITLLVLAVGSIAIQAQTVDTAVLGTVTDPGGAAISGATVVITQPSTGFSRTVTTGEGGIFEVRYLVPGEYVVDVHINGFKAERRTGIEIQLGQQARLDISLKVGDVSETVEVASGVPLLQTENATIAGVVDSERIESLPINGRRFDDLAVLTPGVTVYNPDLHSSSTDGSEIGGNGARLVWGQVNVDGITMVNNRHNYVNLYPSLDAIEEFKVQTGNYSAEYGGNAGTNVNIQIKSGTNKLHGDVFEFFRNEALDARNYFLPAPQPKNELRQNQFGATLGGAIWKDKTFFFGSYEGIRSIADSPSTGIVLTEGQRNGDFSYLLNPPAGQDPIQLIDPKTGAPIPGNIIPQSSISAVAQNIVNTYMPLPNIVGADTPNSTNYAGSSRGNLTVHQGIVRIDQYFSPKDQLFAHYIYAHRDFPLTEINPNFKFTGTYPMHNFQAQYVHTFSPNLINEVRAGFDLENVAQLGSHTNTDFTIESLGIMGMKVNGPNGRPLRKDEEGFPLLEISGYIGMGDDFAASNLDNSKTYQVVDNVTLIKGKHSFKVGGDIRRLLDDATTNNWPFGNLNFTGDLSGDAAADYMLGVPRTVLTPEGVPITKARQWRFAFYGQDDWKVTPKLTLNLGLRYDLFLPPKDINHVTHTLDFSDPANPVFIDAPDPLWQVSHKNFSPRVGFAYSMTPTVVVRGGYGMFYFGGQFDHINILQLNPPTAGSLTITNQVGDLTTIDDPMPASANPTDTINAVTLPPGGTHPNTYAQNWNLQVSKQFGSRDVFEVGYVGSKGTHVDTSFKNWNQPDPGPGDIQDRRPYPTLSRIRMQSYGSNTMYHSLQARFEHRLSKQLNLTAAYTYSHLIDDSGNTTNDGGCQCQNPRDITPERASSLFDQRHLLVIGYVWDIPLGREWKGVAGAVASGWSFQGIVTMASGNPFDILESSDTQNNDGLWERPLLVPGQNISVSNKTPDHWFNTDAFAPSIFVYGDSPRNPVVGPGKHTFDLSLGKTFHMPYSENHSLQFRAEFFNAFNTPQFANPDQFLGDGDFGKVTSTSSHNRELQFGLKYRF